jgi:PHD/YefM family antitoxin component YafN of YafNO toxin-antitoxin module
MRVSATEAKNRFGSLSALAKREPIFIEKAGHLDTVIMSAEQFSRVRHREDVSC